MNYVLTVYFFSGVQEIFLPNVQNRSLTMELNYANASLSLDVFDDVWTVRPNDSVGFDSPQPLCDGLRINAYLQANREEIIILVDALKPEQTQFIKYLVPTTPITVGSDRSNIIRYNVRNLVTGGHMYIEPAPSGATLVDTSRNGTYVNGKRVKKRQTLNYGDTIYVFGLKIIWLDDLLAVNQPKDGYILSGLIRDTPPLSAEPDESPEEDIYYSRSPRRMPNVNYDDIEIDPPPNPAQRRQQPLWMTIGPSLTMVLPMGVGVLFTFLAAQQMNGTTSPYMFMGIFTSITAAVIGVFWALINITHQKKQTKEEEAYRQQRYGEYLDRMEFLISEKQAQNRTTLCVGYPHISECIRWVVTQDRHLWERNVNQQDFLTARLGMGAITSPNKLMVPKSRFSLVEDRLAERPFDIQKKYEMLTNVPICLSFYHHKLVGFIGDDRRLLLETARVIAMQIAIFHSYTDVKMVFIVPPHEEWSFAKWLPHVWSDDNALRMVASDPHGVGEVLYHLSGVIRTRSDEDRQAEHHLPHYVVFIADPDLVENEATIKHITAASQALGFSSLLFYDRLDRLPNHCTVVIQRDAEYNGYYSLDNAFPSVDGVRFDALPVSQFEETARILSGIRVREAEGSGIIPPMLTFLDMYKTSEAAGIDIYRNWLENRTYESMKALIGARGGGAPLYLDIHEKYHGPHGLVAGTTGSGKSEMLQTYILSLAVMYHPYEVSFILIDYKGGGMAESFKDLTHVAGIITNLGGNQTNRALASIKSEIKRRQAVFNEYKIKHIDNYIELFRTDKAHDPMPHLLIIADEFAELKKEQPDFVRELVSASRVGRSLGVHLILATQKPDGVVDEQIWSNTKFRICLRVADKADSMGMLKHPEAAYITQAGRGYFQVGNDEIFEEFQSGWSGARYEPSLPYTDEKSAEVTMINLWGRASMLNVKGKKSSSSTEKIIQLDAITAHISQVSRRHGIKAISNVWLPPLPRQIYLSDLVDFTRALPDKGDLAAPIGLLDDPVNQEQRTVFLNFTQAHHVVVCASVSGGKTTFIQTVLYSLVTAKTSEQLHIYIADYGSRTLGVFAALPHVGGVVFDDDQDRTDKLVALLMKELSRRKLYFSSKGIGSFKEYARIYEDVPAILFVVDNMPGFMENNQKQEDNLIQMAREAASYGIYLLITCTNYSDLRGKLRQNIRFGIGLQLASKFDYDEVLGIRGEMAAEDGCPGRGMIKVESQNKKNASALEFQTALCLMAEDSAVLNSLLTEQFNDIARAWTGAAAARIPQVPKDLSYDAFRHYPETEQAIRDGRLPMGYHMREATLLTLDPASVFCYGISGGARTGKTNTLRLLLLTAAACGHSVFVLDNAAATLSMTAKEQQVPCLTTAEQIYEWLANTMVPEFKRRNGIIRDAGGRKFAAQALANERQIIVLIHDFNAFLNTIYSDTRDMHTFLEQVMKAGNGHKIAFFAVVTREDSMMHGSRLIFSGFTSWKEGVHLGGQVDNQRIFDFEMTPSERIRKYPAGTGHTLVNGKTAQVIIPEV